MEAVRLLALCGSLRQASCNAMAIAALKILAPAQVEVVVADISELPLFNPDREGEKIKPLEDLKTQLMQSSGLIIASPEYAHGISGPLKNTLDWLVIGAEFPNKPIMLINTSPRASYALQSLKEVLVTMSGNVIEKSSVSIPLLGSDLNIEGIVANKAMAITLSAGLDVFCTEIIKLDAGAPR